MSTKTPNSPLFWASFGFMMLVVVGGGIVLGVSTQQYAVVFILQLLVAGTWVAVFYRYRPKGKHSTGGA